MLESFARPATIIGDPNAGGGKTIAQPGQTVTCPNGHPVYRVVEPVVNQTAPKREWFIRIDNGESPNDGVAPPCPACGSEVFPHHANTDFYALFIDGHLVGEPRG